MIKLDFHLLEPPPDIDHKSILGLSWFALFEVQQVIIINDVDFSTCLPLVWGIRSLRILMRRLNTGKSYIIAPPGSAPLSFSPNNGEVTVEGMAKMSDGRCEPMSTTIPTEELCLALKRYTRRVFKKLCKIHPPFRGDSDFAESV